MTYELAKQLKNHGFTSKDKFVCPGYRIFDGLEVRCGCLEHHETGQCATAGLDKICFCPAHLPNPTLYELIEACGESFRSLSYEVNAYSDNTNKVWIANRYLRSNESYMDAKHFQIGEAPEEAVAKLWLTLSKK